MKRGKTQRPASRKQTSGIAATVVEERAFVPALGID